MDHPLVGIKANEWMLSCISKCMLFNCHKYNIMLTISSIVPLTCAEEESFRKVSYLPGMFIFVQFMWNGYDILKLKHMKSANEMKVSK